MKKPPPSPWFSYAVALADHQAELRPGESVLIVGGGGIATAALLVAASLATHIIIASGNAEKLAKAKMLGAAHGVNYRETDFAKEVRSLTGKRGVDVVVDCVGGESWSKESRFARSKGGRLVTCGTVGWSPPPHRSAAYFLEPS